MPGWWLDLFAASTRPTRRPSAIHCTSATKSVRPERAHRWRAQGGVRRQARMQALWGGNGSRLRAWLLLSVFQAPRSLRPVHRLAGAVPPSSRHLSGAGLGRGELHGAAHRVSRGFRGPQGRADAPRGRGPALDRAGRSRRHCHRSRADASRCGRVGGSHRRGGAGQERLAAAGARTQRRWIACRRGASHWSPRRRGCGATGLARLGRSASR